MIEEADRDGSGSIEFQEFLMLMDKAEKDKWTKKELKQVFTVFDKVKSSNEAVRATGLSFFFTGWQWLRLDIRAQVCHDQTECLLLGGRTDGDGVRGRY